MIFDGSVKSSSPKTEPHHTKIPQDYLALSPGLAVEGSAGALHGDRVVAGLEAAV